MPNNISLTEERQRLYQELGKQLKDARMAQKRSLRSVAAALKVCHSSIFYLERGEKIGDMALAMAVCRELKIPFAKTILAATKNAYKQ